MWRQLEDCPRKAPVLSYPFRIGNREIAKRWPNIGTGTGLEEVVLACGHDSR